VLREANRSASESVDVRRVELAAAVAAEMVAVNESSSTTTTFVASTS
jgi:hypothetical protein